MKMNGNNGKLCVVRDRLGPAATIVAAYMVARGVRLQTGEHFGELRRPGEYEVVEVLEPQEPLPSGLASVLGSVMMGEPA